MNSTTVKIGTIPNGIARVIIGYHRLDLGQPVVGQYINNRRDKSITFSSLVTGAKYRITAWGLGGGSDKRRSRSPAVKDMSSPIKSEIGTAYVHTCNRYTVVIKNRVTPLPHASQWALHTIIECLY